ncbi:MAG: LPS assembly protein LptD [Syntrophobacteraceae bacterium]|nr:LPS assembly protein LptD [Syntrophobacteraceae bacterium]
MFPVSLTRLRHLMVISLCLSGLLLPFPGTVIELARAEAELKDLVQNGTLADQLRGTWTIDADQLSYDQERKVYEAVGNVRIVSGKRHIESDWAELDTARRIAELKGNVILKYGSDWLRGEHVIWNLDEETGWVDGGLTYFAANQLYATGENIQKTSATQYELKGGFVTGCDPEGPDWRIRYETMKVNVEGVAWARNTSFWIGDVPVFYLPVVAVPVSRKRQSGFLLPWGGYSDLNGIQGEIPFYWAIRQDMDATFFGRYMSKRGWMSGVEYRIANEKWGEGIWLFNYMNDHADKDHLASQEYPFIRSDRFWLRSRHSFELPWEIDAKMDLDFVSDRNFLREFERGSASIDYSDKTFREHFGRGVINDENTLARESSLYLERRQESSLVSMDTRYWDQQDKEIDEFTLQRLPTLAFNVVPTWIDRLPAYYTFSTSYTNYWRREGDRANRLDVFPRLSLPMQWKNYLDLEPSIGLRATSYWVDWEEDLPNQPNESQGRFFTDLRMEMSSRVNKVHPWRIGSFSAFQHSIRPEVVYQYVPEPVEGTIPFFDRLDEDPSRHDIRYGFTTFLTGKSVKTDAQGIERVSYDEVVRLQLSHGYNFERVPANVPDVRLESSREKGLTDIGLRLDVKPKPYLTLSYDAELDPDRGNVQLHDLYMVLSSGMGHRLRLDYQYRRESLVDEIIATTNIKLFKNFYLLTYHDYSIDQDDLYAHGYGFRYDHGCWAIGVSYEREEKDQRIAFTVNLLGLGAFGGSRSYGKKEVDVDLQ